MENNFSYFQNKDCAFSPATIATVSFLTAFFATARFMPSAINAAATLFISTAE